MAQAYGYNSHMGIGIESSWGTAVARTQWFKLIEDGLKAIEETGKSESFRRRTIECTFPGRKGAAGSMGMECHYEGLESLWKQAFGSVTSAQQGLTSEYHHSFTLADDVLTGLTIEVGRDAGSSDAFIYSGCRTNAFTFSCEPGKIATVSFDYMGKEETTGAPTGSETFPTCNPVLFSHITSTWNSGSAVLKNIELTLSNGLDNDRVVLGSRTALEAVPSDHREITGSFEMYFDSMTIYDDFIAHTDREFKITCDSGTAIPSGDGGNYSYIFTLPVSILQGETPTVDSAGYVSVPFSFESFYDVSGGTDAITLDIYNAVTSVS